MEKFIVYNLETTGMFLRRLAFIVFAFLFAQSAYSDQIPKYDRDLFGGWSDTDRDCQNMRHELLQKLLILRLDFRRHRSLFQETESASPVFQRLREVSVQTML